MEGLQHVTINKAVSLVDRCKTRSYVSTQTTLLGFQVLKKYTPWSIYSPPPSDVRAPSPFWRYRAVDDTKATLV